MYIIETRSSSLETVSLALLVSPVGLYATLKHNVPSSCACSDTDLGIDLLAFTISLDRFSSPWTHMLPSCRSKYGWYS